VAYSLRVQFNTRYLWIGFDVSCEHRDPIGFGEQKWTHVRLWARYPF